MVKKKVLWLSSYLPRSCGIAYYSDDYIRALREEADREDRDVDIKIVSHVDAEEADYPVIEVDDKRNVTDMDWPEKVLEIAKKEKPDIVHIQHEYGLYRTKRSVKNKRVVELIKMLRQETIPVIMTYHSVYKEMKNYQSKFVSDSLRELSAGILHEDYQKQALPNNIGWKPKNVYVLPHGSEENVNVDRERAREWFGYNNELIVGIAGLADERKGFIELIEQWPKVVEKYSNAKLVLELKPLFDPKTREYIDKVLEKVMASNYSDSIEFIVKDYTDKEFYRKLASFDILVLPYKSESQSGVLAHGLAANTPAVVTDIEGLGAEIRKSKAGIAVKDRKYWKAINKLLGDEELRQEMRENAKQYVENVNGWSIIAKKTLGIYDEFWNEDTD